MKQLIALLPFLLLLNCSPSNKAEEKTIDTVQTAPDTILQLEETEEQESERVAREKAAEDEKAYSELNTYDGNYILTTESEGAEGSLELKYMGDKIFTFVLTLKALDICTGEVRGELFMDRTQHGFFQDDGCMLHFNFMGTWGGSGLVVEIEQPEKCEHMKGECVFTGRYVQIAQ